MKAVQPTFRQQKKEWRLSTNPEQENLKQHTVESFMVMTNSAMQLNMLQMFAVWDHNTGI